MGTDIHGWVEFRDAQLDASLNEICWYGVINAGGLLDRDYDAFASLFGVRNDGDFNSIAAGRGLPGDASHTVLEEAIGCHSHTWITWHEIKQIDWNASVVEPDVLVREYKRSSATGQWKSVGRLRRITPQDRNAADTWGDVDQQFRIERLTRREALGYSEFELIFEMMAVLARRYGEDCVRLVVWFDN